MQSKRNPLLFAFLMVASLFFIWGFCHAMLDVLNKHFQNLLSLSMKKPRQKMLWWMLSLKK